jgi:hypothetical protein
MIVNVPEKVGKCIVPDCPSEVIHLRGACRACYLYASLLVFHHLTTWDQLEASGCVSPINGQIKSPKRPLRTEWFSRATSLTPEGLVKELGSRVRMYEKNRKRQRGAF